MQTIISFLHILLIVFLEQAFL